MSRLMRPILGDFQRNFVGCLAAHQKRFVHHHKEYEISKELYTGEIRSHKIRSNRNTHLNERKFRRLRADKTVVVDLEDDVEQRALEKMTNEEVRLAMLKKGVNPYKHVSPREWKEQQLTLQSFVGNLDQYIPPEEGGPWTSQLKNKQEEVKDRLKHKFYNYWHGTRIIRKKVGFENFKIKEFGPTAESIYVSAHEALMERNKSLLHKYITENAFAKMWPDVETGNVSWELIRFNSPSKVISARCSDNPAKSGNHIAQLTVKMHLTQKLTIYDRFGRCLLGSTEEPKECVEYVIFENHIANVDGMWRIHDKVYPEWVEPKQPIAEISLLGATKEVEPPERIGLGMAQRIKKEDKKYEEEKRLGIRK